MFEACALRAPAPPADGFELRGKLAVTEAGERFSGNFIWRQQAERFDINVWGPLGQGRVHLRGNEAELMLLDGREELIDRGPAASVMRTQLGWSLPLEVLPSWVLGEPDGAFVVTDDERDADGRYEAFQQAGWQVRLDDYREVAFGASPRWLPRRVDVRREDTRVRLVIGSWHAALREGLSP